MSLIPINVCYCSLTSLSSLPPRVSPRPSLLQIMSLIQARVGLQRIQKFMEADEMSHSAPGCARVDTRADTQRAKHMHRGRSTAGLGHPHATLVTGLAADVKLHMLPTVSFSPPA